MTVLANLVAITLATGTLALPFINRSPVIALGVWAVAIAAWVRASPTLYAARMAAGGEGFTFIGAVPALLLLQCALDYRFPGLGSALVLFIQLAGITSFVHASDFPTARVRAS